jgi:hypothetical protein
MMRGGWLGAQNHREDNESERRFCQSIGSKTAAPVVPVKRSISLHYRSFSSLYKEWPEASSKTPPKVPPIRL